jgi:hypothetical protein
MYERVGAGAVRLCLFFLDSLVLPPISFVVDGQNHSRAAERGGQCNTQKEKERREEGGKSIPFGAFKLSSKTNWSCAYTTAAHKTDMTLPSFSFFV